HVHPARGGAYLHNGRRPPSAVVPYSPPTYPILAVVPHRLRPSAVVPHRRRTPPPLRRTQRTRHNESIHPTLKLRSAMGRWRKVAFGDGGAGQEVRRRSPPSVGRWLTRWRGG